MSSDSLKGNSKTNKRLKVKLSGTHFKFSPSKKTSSPPLRQLSEASVSEVQVDDEIEYLSVEVENFDQILDDFSLRQQFRKFLKGRVAIECLLFYEAIEIYENIDTDKERQEKGIQIITEHVIENSRYWVNLPADVRMSLMDCKEFGVETFSAAKYEVFKMMEQNFFSAFRSYMKDKNKISFAGGESPKLLFDERTVYSNSTSFEDLSRVFDSAMDLTNRKSQAAAPSSPKSPRMRKKFKSANSFSSVQISDGGSSESPSLLQRVKRKKSANNTLTTAVRRMSIRTLKPKSRTKSGVVKIDANGKIAVSEGVVKKRTSIFQKVKNSTFGNSSSGKKSTFKLRPTVSRKSSQKCQSTFSVESEDC